MNLLRTAILILVLNLPFPLTAQEWRTLHSWSGEAGTEVTGTISIDATAWRLVWNTTAQGDVLAVFSVLVMKGPEWTVMADVASLDAGADTARVDLGAGVYQLEFSSTLPWSASLQVVPEGNANTGLTERDVDSSDGGVGTLHTESHFLYCRGKDGVSLNVPHHPL